MIEELVTRRWAGVPARSGRGHVGANGRRSGRWGLRLTRRRRDPCPRRRAPSRPAAWCAHAEHHVRGSPRGLAVHAKGQRPGASSMRDRTAARRGEGAPVIPELASSLHHSRERDRPRGISIQARFIAPLHLVTRLPATCASTSRLDHCPRRAERLGAGAVQVGFG
jgi:hypothetical protein